MSRALALSLGLSLLDACAVASHPTALAPSPTAAEVALSAPGPIELDSVVSARWAVPLKGLVNLDNPEAEAAGLEDAPTPIVLPVHVLTHPVYGVFVIDTGAPASLEGLGGLVEGFLSEMEIVDPVGDIVTRHGGALDGVLLTHAHVDHVLGLAELGPEVPVYAGPGELSARSATNALTRGAYKRLLEGRGPVREWDFSGELTLGGLPAVDVFGDGSLYALHVPGHTPGSTAYLARTPQGPKLFTGDCAHLYWSWEHGVESGTYTADQALHAQSLDALERLAAQVEGVQVFVGHELDGVGTGVAGL
ncbi:MAG: MBL fold metallo-hydrolase [Alphaproteobacteria bacterium]|nr:MBL fold metallo-hydrolase [Alphaproteobacteria bacterium]